MTLDAAIERYARSLVRHPARVLALSLLLVGSFSIGVFRLEIDSDYRAFFAPDDPNLVAFDRLQNTFVKDDGILFVVAPRSGNVFSREALSAIQALTREAWKLPFATRVDSVTNFQNARVRGDDIVVSDLVPDVDTMTEEQVRAAAQIATSEPQLARRLVSTTGSVAGVNVRLTLTGASRDEVGEAVAAARELAATIEREHPTIDVRLTGLVMLDNAFSEAVVDDLVTLVPAMYVVMFSILLWNLGSLSGALATGLMIALSALPAMGIAGFLGLGVTPPLAQAPTMIMTLAVADTAHFLTATFRAMHAGTRKEEAIVQSMRENFKGVFFTSLTTVIGYLTMNFSDSPPFHHLGNVTAVGVVFAYLNSVTFLPALVALLPMRVHPRAARPERLLEALAGRILRHRRIVLYASAAVTLASLALIPGNRLDDGFINYFDGRTSFRADTDFTLDNLTGIYSIDYALGSETDGGVTDPRYLATLDAFAAWFRQQPHVVHVASFSDVMKKLSQTLEGGAPEAYRLPETRELGAQYLLLYELSLPTGLDLNDRIDVDRRATRLTVTLDNLSSRELRELGGRAESWLKQHAPASMFARGVSTSVIFVELALSNIEGMFSGTALELAIISALLIVALRSVRFGLLSLVPNLVPMAVALGIWALADGRMNLGLSVVAGMTLGIVVDDTVHFLIKYLDARREGLPAGEAVSHVYASVGPAILSTTVMLVAGFSVLSLSSFAVTADMGKLTAMTLAIAVAGDMLLLPCLLTWAEGTEEAAGARESENAPQGDMAPPARKAVSENG